MKPFKFIKRRAEFHPRTALGAFLVTTFGLHFFVLFRIFLNAEHLFQDKTPEIVSQHSLINMCPLVSPYLGIYKN